MRSAVRPALRNTSAADRGVTGERLRHFDRRRRRRREVHPDVGEDPPRLVERAVDHDDVLIGLEGGEPGRSDARALRLGGGRVERDEPDVDAAQALACLVDEFERTELSVVQPHVANGGAKGVGRRRLVLDDVRLRAGQLAADRERRVPHHGDDHAREQREGELAGDRHERTSGAIGIACFGIPWPGGALRAGPGNTSITGP